MKHLFLKTWLMLVCLLVGVGTSWADTYVQLTSIASIDESAEYVLGIDGTGFHKSGTSSWGVCTNSGGGTPLKYKLVKAADGKSFKASTEIGTTTYYLTVPTSNTFSMATSSTAANTDIIIGTTQVSGTNYAVTNKGTTARHLRLNGTSGLRSYAGTTGTMAFFYKVVPDGPAVSSIAVKTAPTKTTYMEGETFDPAGLVITKTMSNATTADVAYSGNEDAFTFNPSLETELSNETSVTITYGKKTTTQAITVNPFVATAGTYNISMNNGLYGVSTGNNGTEQSKTKSGITVVSGCKSSATSKTYYDAAHIRYYTDSYLKLTAPEGFEITKVVFTAGGTWNSGPDCGSNGTYDNDTKTWEGKTSQLDLTFSDQNRIKTIAVTYAAATTPDPDKTLVSISTTGTPAEFWKGDTFNHNGMTVTATWDDETTTDVTSSCEFTGHDMSAAGQQTVTVTYLEKTTTYNINVKTIANTEATAYTVAEAKALIDAGNDLSTEVYVKGTVSRVESYNSTYGSITYWLDENSFEIYGGLNLNGAEFNPQDDIKIGAEVIVLGVIKKYSSTYEMDKNNVLVSYTAPTTTKETATISAPDAKTELNTGATDVYTVSYDGDGVLEVVSSDTDVAEVSINNNEVTVTAKAVGTTKITISAPATDNYYAAKYEYTLTVTKAPFVPTPATDGYEAVDFTGLYSSVTTNATVEDYEGTSFAMAFAKPEGSSTPTKYYDNGKAVRAYTNNTITITAAEAIKHVDIAWTGTYVDDKVTITGLGTTTAVITFSKTCRFTDISVCYAEPTLALVAEANDKKYATFSSDKAVKFIGDETFVYAINVENDGLLTRTKIIDKKVPANTGVLIESVGESTPYVYVGSAAEVEDNMLKAASVAMEGEYSFYKLAYGDYDAKTQLGFYYGAENGAAFTAKDGGAYLAVPSSIAVKGFRLFDDATAISSATIDAARQNKFLKDGRIVIMKNNKMYNTAGQQIK